LDLTIIVSDHLSVACVAAHGKRELGRGKGGRGGGGEEWGLGRGDWGESGRERLQ